MNLPRTLTVLLSSDLLTLSRTCGVLRRRNLPIRALAVDSHGPPGIWRMSCEIDADDPTVESLVLQIQNVVGVRKATAASIAPSGGIMSSSVRVYYEADTDGARLRDRVFAIIGYGSQGHAHAQNLRDSGARVIVGLRPNGASWKRAGGDGLEVRPVAEAAKAGDVIMMLVPDQEQRAVYETAVVPALGAGKTLMFAHGFNIHFGEIVPPPAVDVSLIAPKSPGHLVRSEFQAGRGVPGLVAVHQDASGKALANALAYATGIGCSRAGVIATTFAEETETDLFGEQAVLCGGVTALIQAGFETLTEAGYSAEMAYFECLHELKLIVDLIYSGGLGFMRHSISNTAEYGDLTRGDRVISPAVREEMRRMLADIRSGAFAKEWIAECRAGAPRFNELRRAAQNHPIEQVGARLRAMMPWTEEGRAFGGLGLGGQRMPPQAPPSMTQTLFDRIWSAHVVEELADGVSLLYVDLHLVHEVTSPQAFAGLRREGRRVRRPERTLATVDHNVPTGDRSLPIADPVSALQVDALDANTREFGIELFGLTSPGQGIVHVIGPELGATQPGMLIVCGDSHTSTHGAFGAFALGIGTSEVEHVLATQCIVLSKPRNLEARMIGSRALGVGAKDLILALIGKIGTAGAAGHVIEYTGDAIRALSMEERMTVCNMSIEAGARAGMIAPDEVTFAYLEGRPRAPQGEAWWSAVERWRTYRSDPIAPYDARVTLDASRIGPQVTWGTTPGMVADISGRVPEPAQFPTASEREAATRALEYMGLKPGTPLEGIPIDRVFLGSCTNARIEDLRAAANVVRGRHVAARVRAMVVPGSQRVKAQAEHEGLDRVFRDAGFEWRNAGCSMCLGMNDDVLGEKERCAATSNRNFEGRQGKGGRTHLMSPVMAAAAAIEGRLVDVRGW